MFIWQCIPAPPVCIRPSISQDGASTEDDLTVKLTEIIWTNSLIKSALEKGTPIQNLMVFYWKGYFNLILYRSNGIIYNYALLCILIANYLEYHHKQIQNL